jgi:hypothetical protein
MDPLPMMMLARCVVTRGRWRVSCQAPSTCAPVRRVYVWGHWFGASFGWGSCSWQPVLENSKVGG